MRSVPEGRRPLMPPCSIPLEPLTPLEPSWPKMPNRASDESSDGPAFGGYRTATALHRGDQATHSPSCVSTVNAASSPRSM
jgi:hypothetical protein